MAALASHDPPSKMNRVPHNLRTHQIALCRLPSSWALTRARFTALETLLSEKSRKSSNRPAPRRYNPGPQAPTLLSINSAQDHLVLRLTGLVWKGVLEPANRRIN